MGLTLASCAGSSAGNPPPPEKYVEVLKYWELSPKDNRYRVDFKLLDDWLGMYRFTPANPSQWVIFTHGILDHIGTSSILIRYLLDRNVGVVAFDLPGHGLSRGDRADIDDFNTYGLAWARIMQATQDLYPRTAMGHSTGAAALLTFTQREGSILPERIILLAPLVRNVFWDLSRFAYSALGWATAYVPANDGAASRDRDWLTRWRNDPLTVKALPLSWFRALQNWEAGSHQWKTQDGSRFHIIQGTQDGVVDWNYNLPFLEERYSGINVHYVQGAWHGLQYDIPAARDQFYSILSAILEIP